jgi:hypothetical protein
MFIFTVFRWIMRVIGIAVAAALVFVIVCAVQIATTSQLSGAPSSVGPAQGIVVMGGPIVGMQPSSDLLGRLRQALLLYQTHRAPIIVVTGPPNAVGLPSITSIELSWLRRNGVPKTALESAPVTGVTQSLLQASGLFSAGAHTIIVTDAVDALYDRSAAANLGLNAQISPAVGSNRAFFTEFESLFREATALAAGRIFGYPRISWAAG